MEIHSDEECENNWREIFSKQIEDVLNSHWPVENDDDFHRVKWFQEGLRYAMMVVRWDSVN